MDNTKKERLYTIVNLIATGIIAMSLTGPVHEFTHLVTQLIAGCTPEVFSYAAVSTGGTPSVNLDSFIWKIMYEGSAALLNIVVGLVLLLVLNKVKMKALSRAFVVQLTLMHLCMGFGYFLRDGILYSDGTNLGDWAKVIGRFGGSGALRVTLVVLGCIGILLTFYIAFYEAYHFIGDNNNRPERRMVSSTLYFSLT